MLQSNLSSTLNYGRVINYDQIQNESEEGSLQEIEKAGRFVDKYLNSDSSFPSLFDLLRVPAQGKEYRI